MGLVELGEMWCVLDVCLGYHESGIFVDYEDWRMDCGTLGNLKLIVIVCKYRELLFMYVYIYVFLNVCIYFHVITISYVCKIYNYMRHIWNSHICPLA